MDVLPAPFVGPPGKRIGEIWFEPPEVLPDLLVKYIFTSEPLSVQVHPSDAQTMAAGLGRQGKEECWLILTAEPGAKLGIGFRHHVSDEEIRSAALDGSIENLMAWHEVEPGDFFYIPANTVHAIGAGIGLIEVQQNSDITYRLFDYGRPRELHIEDGLKVALCDPYDLSRWRKKASASESKILVEGPYFRMEQAVGLPSLATLSRHQGGLLLIPRTGYVEVGGEVITPAECGFVSGVDEVSFLSNGVFLLVGH